MATTNNNRKILDLKRWEFCTPAPMATAAGHFIVSSRHYRQQQLLVQSAAIAYLYNPHEDGWVALPSPALGGTFGAGACGTATAVGPSGTATGGSTTTIATNLTLARNLSGYSIHITGGPNAGLTLPIVSNTVGANAVITVAEQASAFTSSTTYRLLTPRWWVLNAIASAGTTTANLFKYYDFATNTWSAAETGATDGVAPYTTIGTDCRLIATPSWMDDGYVSFANFTAASATNTTNATITKSGADWITNQWANYQVRVVSGTGAGQIKTITSNTATVLTLAGTFATPLDDTSVIAIEGNDDYIYWMGSNQILMFRYSISAGTWTVLNPSVTRVAQPGLGMSAHWVWGVSSPDWNNENSIINGRRIYSFRGAAGSVLDYYDIALNVWASAVTYSPAVETFTTGTKYAYCGDCLFIQKEATGRWFKYDFALQQMEGWGTMLYPQGTAVLGDTAFDVVYHDGGDDIVWIYMLLNSSAILLRQMVI